MAKKFTYRGKSIEELKQLQLNELASLMSARQKRTLSRGLTDTQKKFLAKVESFVAGKRKKPVKTHCRDMIVLPSMVGAIIQIHNGREFQAVTIIEDMVGHYLGEFSQTRRPVKHSGPGVGATRSTKHVSVK